jgi:protein-S-isoprenylcysteine O-methyltransferase Ste14
MKRITQSFLKRIKNYFVLLISMSGYVLRHATFLRTIVMSASLVFYFYLIYFQTYNTLVSTIYFVLSEILYIGFIYCVLSENGYRHWFIKKWGSEDKGYLAFEAILGFLFFNNGASITYIALSTSGSLFNFIPKEFLFAIVFVMFAVGLIVKILATETVSVDIYYWKDMFLGKKICNFVISGPYKYFNNPMYGTGQLQAYAVAIWYGSILGLFVTLLNQCLVFSFYFCKEKKFIEKNYKI